MLAIRVRFLSIFCFFLPLPSPFQGRLNLDDPSYRVRSVLHGLRFNTAASNK